MPLNASSRKQIRHKPKRRMNARPRPHRLQRLFRRPLNFGFRFCLSINDLGGIYRFLSSVVLNGMPSSFSSARA